MTRIIALSNDKGGCGKTLTTVSLAAALAKKKKKVLVIDTDPHCHATRHFRKGNFQESIIGPTIYDAMASFSQADTAIKPTEFSNIFLMKGDPRIKHLDNNDIWMIKYITQHDYSSFDYVLVDTQPSDSLARSEFMMMVDNIIIPLFPDDASISGFANQLRQVNSWSKERETRIGKGINLLGAVIINHKASWSLHRKNAELLAESFKRNNIKLLGIIPQSAIALTSDDSAIPIPFAGRYRKSAIAIAIEKLGNAVDKSDAVSTDAPRLKNEFEEEMTI